MLEVGFSTFGRIVLQHHLAIIFSAFVYKAAHFIVVVEHHIDAIRRVVIPSREHQQMRAFGDLRLVVGSSLNLGTSFRMGDHEHFVGLQAT